MRVRISYGVEIEEIPEHVSNLGYDALIELKESCTTLSRALENIEECDKDFSLVVQMVENVRLKLTKTDASLVDISSILEGLHNYHNGEQNVSERRPTVDSSGNTTTQTKDIGKG